MSALRPTGITPDERRLALQDQRWRNPEFWGAAFLLVCRECWPDATGIDGAIPFRTAAERGSWAANHTAGTGHAAWIVLDFPEVAR